MDDARGCAVGRSFEGENEAVSATLWRAMSQDQPPIPRLCGSFNAREAQPDVLPERETREGTRLRC